MVSSSGLCSRLAFVLRLLILAFFLAALTPSCKAQDKVELYGGYSYFRASIEVAQTGPLGPGTPCPPNCGTPPRVGQNANLNGWELSGQYKFVPFLGAVVDIGGNYGSLQGASVREHTYLFGPQVSLPRKVSPFAHALIGVARESQDAFLRGGFNSLGSDSSLATAVGAGIDVKLVPFARFRLIEIDYLRTQLHGTTQNQPRVSAGIVIHF